MKLHVSPCPYLFIFDTRLLVNKITKFKMLKLVVHFIIAVQLIVRMVKTDSIIRKFFIEGVFCYYDNI